MHSHPAAASAGTPPVRLTSAGRTPVSANASGGPFLSGYASTQSTGSVTAQRLGYVLEQVGQADLASTVESWLDGKLRRALLVPASGHAPKGRLIARWQILDNSGEFTA